MNFKAFTKTLAQLEEMAVGVERIFHKQNAFVVDIELTLEKSYDVHIDVLALNPGGGVEAYLNLSLKTIYIDVNLVDLDYNEPRYRFTLAEELAHLLLHPKLYDNIRTIEDYWGLREAMSEKDNMLFELNAKALAGMILMPIDSYVERLAAHRDTRMAALGSKPSIEAQSLLVSEVRRELMDDFEVSEDAVRHRLRHITELRKKDFFKLP